MTGYGIQIVSAPSDFNKCLKPLTSYIKIKSFESHDKVAIEEQMMLRSHFTVILFCTRLQYTSLLMVPITSRNTCQ